jgi:hypothetical protein
MVERTGPTGRRSGHLWFYGFGRNRQSAASPWVAGRDTYGSMASAAIGNPLPRIIAFRSPYRSAPGLPRAKAFAPSVAKPGCPVGPPFSAGSHAIHTRLRASGGRFSRTAARAGTRRCAYRGAAQFGRSRAPGANIIHEFHTVIRLGPHQTIVLGYIASCVRETITGGTVTVGTQRSEVQSGHVRRIEGHCYSGRMEPTGEQAHVGGVFRGPAH